MPVNPYANVDPRFVPSSAAPTTQHGEGYYWDPSTGGW